jgi:putative redox protein
MKIQSKWVEKMKFTAEDESNKIVMDAKSPIGTGLGLTPKHLLLAGICGCTGMDVVALLKKYKQPFESLEINAESALTEGSYPAVFKDIKLIFKVNGPVDSTKLLEAISLSQTKFCGVTAMISKSVPISYTVDLNGETIGSGKADFL